MSRHVNGPWFRSSKNTWYVTHGGRKVSLGVSGKNNRKAAVESWHRLLREGQTDRHRVVRTESKTVAEAVAEFMAVVAVRNKASTHRTYDQHLTKLVTALGPTPVRELAVTALAEWLRGLKVSSTTQAITLRSVSAFLGWCVRQEIIDRNPASAVAKPKAKSRGKVTFPRFGGVQVSGVDSRQGVHRCLVPDRRTHPSSSSRR